MRYRFFKLIILIFLFLTSCSLKGSEKIIASQEQPVQGQILVWHSFEGKIKDMIQQSFNDYRQLYPNVRIVSEYIPADQLEQQFRKQVNQGLGPDFLFTTSGVIPSLIHDNLIPVIDDFDFSSYLPTAMSHVRYQGKIYGIPTSVMTQVLCYNKKKVKSPPKTLTELLQQAKAGYSVGIWSTFITTFWGVQVFGGKSFNTEGDFIFDKNSWAKWMEWLKNAQSEPNMIFTDSIDVLQQAFTNQRLAYVFCDSSQFVDYEQALGKDNLGITILPGEENNPAAPLLYSRVILFNRMSSPEQQQLSQQLAQFFTNREQIRKRLMILRGSFIPAYQVHINSRLFPLEAILVQQAKTAIAIPLDQVQSARVWAKEGSSLYPQVLAGSITPENAAQKISETVNQKLSQP
ncbi:Maltotriose-binding protein [Planktothrix tepida]|uniref:Extracellular solute-binding protein family 1 n=1 Tax=Planktothrix tepida PCC 9214 TaxID=671072 RepID=A0A1J1LHQ1_9CYAN|nr:extracellular solute-binding protein [Planktothrix tepida]CAD5928281.1 Maltotriose-binding protein [Planktothrix tepida]CUR31412.1 Extracellular solute-binding protein family 1 [Planktothrix tepida PCC 9214]